MIERCLKVRLSCYLATSRALAFIETLGLRFSFPISLLREQYFVFLKKLTNALNSGTMTRADAVRNVVESQVVVNTYVIPALVTMEYFGYLHRDPDVIGYQNRVNTLGSDPSDYRHNIFGFIYSTEYRNRFGTP